MELSFEWGPAKDEANTRKHGVTFEEASTAFGDPLSATITDPEQLGARGAVPAARPGERRACPHHQRAARDPPRTEAMKRIQ